eukprot:scaffold26528_cov36-Cyclotella_meneghiniana.AAC.2
MGFTRWTVRHERLLLLVFIKGMAGSPFNANISAEIYTLNLSIEMPWGSHIGPSVVRGYYY